MKGLLAQVSALEHMALLFLIWYLVKNIPEKSTYLGWAMQIAGCFMVISGLNETAVLHLKFHQNMHKVGIYVHFSIRIY